MDWIEFEKNLPSKIRNTRKRSNASGFDYEYIKKIKGIVNGRSVIMPGLTKTGKKRIASYCGHLCQSITFGRVIPRFKKNAICQDRIANALYPNLYLNLKSIASTMFPEFEYNTITLNHNFKCEPHKDGRNVGDSIIIGFGDYKDGELNIENVKHNIKYKPLRFNGAISEHWVEDFDGERWTAIYFKTKFK